MQIQQWVSRHCIIGDSALFNHNGIDGFNTAVGFQALYANTSGNNNTAIGKSSLSSNTTGILNTALGINSLSNNLGGISNTAIGARALQFTNNDYNTAAGASALRFNTGIANTALGFETLVANNTGTYNTAAGVQSLYHNQTGSFNTSMGLNSLYNNIGSNDNTAMGAEALFNNTTAGNTAFGRSALFNTNNVNNTGVGVAALAFNITGYYNTALGAAADLSYSNLYNATAIGYNARSDDFHRVWVGSTTINSIGGSKSWSTFSDGRYKEKVEEDVKGLEFIKLLRPVTYILNMPAMNAHYNIDSTGLTAPPWQNERLAFAATHRESGFIAQEVEAAANKSGFTFSGVDKPIDQRASYGLRYADFVVPLVKAVQEQQPIIDEQNKKIDMLVKEMQEIKSRIHYEGSPNCRKALIYFEPGKKSNVIEAGNYRCRGRPGFNPYTYQIILF